MQKNNSLPDVIKMIKNRCVNCHQCISVCPVKYCNDASNLEEGITINPNLCIGCGACIKVCTHKAREIIDDTIKFFDDLRHGERIIVLVAPAVDVNFPGQLKNLLGWFKHIKIQKNFDVSFGGEITSYEYAKAYKNNIDTPLIAQACPCVVNFIEIYKPSLVKYLAPIGSPVMNLANWVHSIYPSHKLAFISPCIAKKREFDDPNTKGLISYNVTIQGLKKYMNLNGINLNSYNEINFDGIAEAEKGILYSQPGGLYESIKKYKLPIKSYQVRQIEGTEIYQEFFDELENDILNSVCDIAIVDALNCTHGCNRGTGTNYNERTTNDVLHLQSERLEKHKNEYYKSESDYAKLLSRLENISCIDFSRKYSDKSDFYRSLENPTSETVEVINREMGKFSKYDIKDCGACGYNSCTNMVKAIVNGLYRPQQCHHFLESFYKRHSGDND